MTQNKSRDEQLEKYIKLCRDNWHSVYGISEAYCRADFTAGYDAAEKQYLGEIEGFKKQLTIANEALGIIKHYRSRNGDDVQSELARNAIKKIEEMNETNIS